MPICPHPLEKRRGRKAVAVKVKTLFAAFSVPCKFSPRSATHPDANFQAGESTMSTDSQTTANQLNSQKCTGPVSAEGKAKSSQNSLKTGLYAKSDVIATRKPR